MDSKEFGLVAAQQLLQMQDLHYGFWETGEAPDLKNFQAAQDRHSEFLFSHIQPYVKDKSKDKLIDIGCGIGITTQKLLAQGYRVDGLVPYAWMAEYARKNAKAYADATKGHIFECGFEDLPLAELKEKYAVAFFSESYQYVDLQKGFDMLRQILNKDGHVIIFDFFKRDNVEGVSPIGGGYSLNLFYDTVKANGFEIVTDIDVTDNLSPNIKLVNDIVNQRLLPFGQTLDAFLTTKLKWLYKLIKRAMKKKIDKGLFKYKNRTADSFAKYKTYRLIVLKQA